MNNSQRKSTGTKSVTKLNLDDLMRPTHSWMPQAVWSEVLPGLWQGGTVDRFAPDEWMRGETGILITKQDFDSVYTMYASAEPVDWFVKELRLGFYDSHDHGISIEQQLFEVVEAAHRDWVAGKRVLIRCQAGLNRSGLVMGLVLVRAGYDAADAIALIRERRSDNALFNDSFVEYLLDADLDFWRAGLALAA